LSKFSAKWHRTRSISVPLSPHQAHSQAYWQSPYPRAIAEELGESVEHEVCPCTANPVEQSHRRIKPRYYPTLGFGEFETAQWFYRSVDEVSDFLRPRSRMAEVVSLPECRERFMKGGEEREALFKAT